MRKFLNFNLRRVTTEDLNNTEKFIDENSEDRSGIFMSPGIVKARTSPFIGAIGGGNTISAEWTLIGSTNNKFSIPVPTGSVLLAIDNNNDIILIENNTNYNASADQFTQRGNLAIPLPVATAGYYYVWVSARDILDSTYQRVDKTGGIHYPSILLGYEIYIVYNAGNVNPASIIPPGAQCYIGNVKSDGSGNITATYLPPTTYDPFVKFSGIQSQNVKIDVNTATPPKVYGEGISRLSLHDHINALGSVSTGPTVLNPHALGPSDISAIDAIGTSAIGIFKNGILLANDKDYISATTSFQATIWNVGSNPYLRLYNDGHGTKFIINGKIYNIADISTFGTNQSAQGASNWTNSVILFVPLTTNTGWYSVYINLVGTIPTLQFVSATSGPFFYQDDSDSNIYLGFFYWNKTSFKIQFNESSLTYFPVTNGNQILPFYTWGSIGPKQTSKVIDDEYSTHSKNLISFNYRNDQVGDPNSTAMSIVAGGGAMTMTKAGGASADINATLSVSGITANPWRGEMKIWTMPAIARGLNSQPTGKSRIYTLQFTYSGATDYSDGDILVSADGGTNFYHLPLINGPTQFKITTNIYPTYIQFIFNKTTTTTVNSFSLTNVQFVEGLQLSDVEASDITYTNSIAFDSSVGISQVGNNTGTLAVQENRITKMNLDNILQLLPFGTQIAPNTNITVNGLTSIDSFFSSHFMSSTFKNVELWIVQGQIQFVPNVHSWESPITWNSSKYSLISCLFMPLQQLSSYEIGNNVYQALYVKTVASGNILVAGIFNASGTTTGYYTGFMLMQRLTV